MDPEYGEIVPPTDEVLEARRLELMAVAVQARVSSVLAARWCFLRYRRLAGDFGIEEQMLMLPPPFPPIAPPG